MQFSQTLATIRPSDTGWSAEIGEDWLQGRAVFGGMVAALGNEAMRRLVSEERQLRALETVFLRPVVPGKVHLDAEILRIGKAVTIAVAKVISDDSLAATLTGIYGAARTMAITFERAPPAGVPGPEAVADLAPPPGSGFPVFLQHFGLKFAEGTRPFTGTNLNRSKVYIRHNDRAGFAESHLVALIDCVPPPLLQMMTSFAPNSSLTWTIEMLRHDYLYAPQAWWRIDTEVLGAGDGYSQESSVVLDPSGRAAALSRQLVAIFG